MFGSLPADPAIRFTETSPYDPRSPYAASKASSHHLVRMICAILDAKRPRARGRYAEQITFVPDRPGHDARHAIDPSRIREDLGWPPSVTVEEGQEKTVRWYLDNETWWRKLQGRYGVGQRLGSKASDCWCSGKPARWRANCTR